MTNDLFYVFSDGNLISHQGNLYVYDHPFDALSKTSNENEGKTQLNLVDVFGDVLFCDVKLGRQLCINKFRLIKSLDASYVLSHFIRRVLLDVAGVCKNVSPVIMNYLKTGEPEFLILSKISFYNNKQISDGSRNFDLIRNVISNLTYKNLNFTAFDCAVKASLLVRDNKEKFVNNNLPSETLMKYRKWFLEMVTDAFNVVA